MQWFIKEQVEEVSSMSALLKVVERAKDNPLLAEEYLAREKVAAARASTPPPRPPPAALSSGPTTEPAGPLAQAFEPAELGDVLAQGGGSRGGKEAGRQGRLGDPVRAARGPGRRGHRGGR